MLRFVLLSILTLLYYNPLAAQEICNNGIDDDNDGFVDCFDSECGGTSYCDSTFVGNTSSSCSELDTVIYSPAEEWISPSTHLIFEQSHPAVGDIDNDGVVEAVVFGQNSSSSVPTIRIFNAATGAHERTITLAVSAKTQSSSMSIGNVDATPTSEIFYIDANGFVRCYTYDGTLLWTSNVAAGNGISYTNSAPPTGLADFNQDGVPELYVNNEIFNAQTGVRIAAGSGSRGRYYNSNNAYIMAVAADVLPDGFCADCSGLELVAGNQVYSVNIGAGTMTVRTTAASGRLDGLTAVADLDQDGDLDAAVLASGGFGQTYLYAWDLQTSTIMGVYTYSTTFLGVLGSSIPAIGDLDGNGYPEVVFVALSTASSSNMYAIRGFETASLSPLWTKSAIQEQSTGTSVSLFDFNGDGLQEVVYRDQANLMIVNGTDGSNYYTTACLAGTFLEAPIIADLDGDGQAEILSACYDASGGAAGQSRLRSFGADTGTAWMPARRVWNQYAYYGVNVQDDLGIPREQQNHAVAAALNVFKGQQTYLDAGLTPTYTDPYVDTSYFSCGVLALSFTDFQAYAFEERVQLGWLVEDDFGPAIYHIERKLAEGQYQVVGTVNGNESGSYGYQDREVYTLTGERVSYRIRRISAEGSEMLSEVRTLTISSNPKLVVFPNPSVGNIHILGLNYGQKVKLDVYDLKGLSVFSEVQEQFFGDELEINLSLLPKGLYQLVISQGEMKQIEKIVIK